MPAKKSITMNTNAKTLNYATMSSTPITISSGGTLNVGANGGYLRVGVGYTHPEVSGLNVTGGFGIKSHSGIVATGFGITDSDSGKSASFQVQRQGGGYYYITFTGNSLLYRYSVYSISI